MKIKLLIVFFIICTLSLSLNSDVNAQTVTPGVSNEDVFEYNYSVAWSSTNPISQAPDWVNEQNRIMSFQIKINRVSDTTVNAEVTTRYRDGTSQKETGFVDVKSGSIRLTFGYLIIAGNLNVNDRLYPFGSDATINSSTSRTYSTGNRQTLIHTIDAIYDLSSEKKEFYFDRIKGIAVEYHFESKETVGSYTETFTETITNTNSDVWSVVPEFPVFVVPLVLVAVSVALLVTKYKKSSNIQLFKI